MPTHYTYESAGEHLQQGDVLKRTTDIESLLKEVHPHFYNSSSYSHFMVITQSCDLVRRRGGPCSSRYITLAGVRPFELALDRELEKYQSKLEKLAKVAKQQTRERLKDYIKKILNNNIHTAFYLHNDSSIGINEPCCAFLRLSIAIRSYDHYDTCMAARITSLKPEFQAKLGWMVGNIYSRVGTKDWTPTHETEEELQTRTNDILDGLCSWMPDKQILLVEKAIKSKKCSMPNDETQALNLINDYKEVSSKQVIAEELGKILRDQELLSSRALSQPDINKVIKALNNTDRFKRILK